MPPAPAALPSFWWLERLNEGFTGGATAFHDFGLEVAPRTGMALLFQHLVLHEGCELIAGTKYVLRSDVMYEA